MAEKKTTTKKKSDKVFVTYKGARYEALEKLEDRYKLTDGLIHFYVKAKDVTE